MKDLWRKKKNDEGKRNVFEEQSYNERAILERKYEKK
jgi:hypothetical protein